MVLGELGYYFYLTRLVPKPEPSHPAVVSQPSPTLFPKEIFAIENQYPQFTLSLNPAFSQQEVEALVKKYGKRYAVVKIVSSREQIPQRPDGMGGGVGTHFPLNGEIGLIYSEMSEYQENGASLYFYPEIDNLKNLDSDFKIEKVISLGFLRALANSSPAYLMPDGEDLLPSGSGDIEKYATTEPFLFKAK